MSAWRKLGVIAGGGDLPVALAEHCAAQGLEYFVARITPIASPELDSHPGASHGLGAMGARMEALRDAGCDAIVFVGQVLRQDPRALELDAGGMAMVPALLAAAPKGDDALLRALIAEHEKAGFRVLGVDAATEALLAPVGAWGARTPDAVQQRDISEAARVAAAIGALDVGQAVVVCDGLVLAVEAQEGTDAMLRRVPELREALRGTPSARRGVLLKRAKPTQDLRIDLPTIGVRTIEGAAAAGLAGVAVEAGRTLAVRRDAIIAAADRLGLFVYGFSADEVA